MKIMIVSRSAYKNGIHFTLHYPKICPRNPLMKLVATTAATPRTAAPVQLTTPDPVYAFGTY